MKKVILYISIFLGALSVYSCEDSLKPYSDPTNRIAFVIDQNDPDTYYTFAYFGADVTEDVVNVPVTAIGFITDYPRTVTVRQITEDGREDAVVGVHYVALNESALIIPAGATGMEIPITVLRDESLSEQDYVLELELVANDDFQLGYPNSITKRVIISDILVRPSTWTGSTGSALNWYFGTYSTTRHQVMNLAAADYGQIIDDEWVSNIADGYTVDPAEIAFWQGCFRAKLAEINAERAAQGLGNLLNDNGTVLTFP